MMYPAVLFALALLICRGFQPARCEEEYIQSPSQANDPYDLGSSLAGHHHHGARSHHPAGASYDFCSRILAGTRTCPDPPTTNGFRVEDYLGTWYEIGSTALYKFQYERGLICTHTVHSLDQDRDNDDQNGPALSIMGRGYQTLTTMEDAGISRLSAAVNGVCSNARTVCTVLAPRGLLRESVSQLLDTIGIIRNDSLTRYGHETTNLATSLRNLQFMTNNIQANVDVLSTRVSRLQALNANISQGAGDKQQNINALMEDSSSLDTNIQTLALRVSERASNIKAEVIQQANIVRPENAALAWKLERSVLAVYAELSSVETYLTQIATTLTGISAGTRALAAMPTRDPALSLPAREVQGVAEQDPSNHGKLTLSLSGDSASQYWVLDVERSNDSNSRRYTAVLVYSCNVEKGLGGLLPREHLFVLAKNRTLPFTTVKRFLQTARSHGIYPECDNPFVATVQHGSCSG